MDNKMDKLAIEHSQNQNLQKDLYHTGADTNRHQKERKKFLVQKKKDKN